VARRLTDTRVVTCAAPNYLVRHGRPARAPRFPTPNYDIPRWKAAQQENRRPRTGAAHKDPCFLGLNINGFVILERHR
jgi:hypothetical protein